MKRYAFRMSGMVDVEAHAAELEAKAAEGSDAYAEWMRAEAKRVRESPDVYVKLEDVLPLIDKGVRRMLGLPDPKPHALD